MEDRDKQLGFVIEHVKKIKSGTKTTTLRTLGSTKEFRVGDILNVNHGAEDFRLKITKIGTKKLYALTDEDARKEGFRSIDELMEAWETTYRKNWNPDYVVRIIEFEKIEG